MNRKKKVEVNSVRLFICKDCGKQVVNFDNMQEHFDNNENCHGRFRVEQECLLRDTYQKIYVDKTLVVDNSDKSISEINKLSKKIDGINESLEKKADKVTNE